MCPDPDGLGLHVICVNPPTRNEGEKPVVIEDGQWVFHPESIAEFTP